MLATLGILVVLLCLSGVTAVAIIAVQFTKWDVLSGLLATLLAVLATAIIGLILDAADRWLDRVQNRPPVDGNLP